MVAGLDVFGVLTMKKITKNDFIQFLKFNIVGISNTLVDFGVYTLLTAVFGLDAIVANLISYPCGIVNSYIWNSSWTFKKERKRTKREILLFIAVNLVALAVSTGVIYACRVLFGVDDDIMRKLLYKLLATAVSIIVNFIGNKLFVFKSAE